MVQEVSLEVTGLEGTMVERVPGRPVGKLAQLSWKTDAEVLQLRVTGTDQCTVNGLEKCSSCNAGYYMSGSVCNVNTCTCSGGTGSTEVLYRTE